MQKLEFGSAAWIDALRVTIADALAAAGPEADEVSFSICEIYRDPPAHIVPETGVLGWHCRIVDRSLSFVLSPADDVDVVVDADYDALLPLARMIYGDDPEVHAERDRVFGRLLKDGRMRVRGDLDMRPAFLDGVHDTMARITA
jgi:hypothetical protein